ncbi:unnamed protein product, partial (macronuclear) [Paramecium tetraurelia]
MMNFFQHFLILVNFLFVYIIYYDTIIQQFLTIIIFNVILRTISIIILILLLLPFFPTEKGGFSFLSPFIILFHMLLGFLFF